MLRAQPDLLTTVVTKRPRLTHNGTASTHIHTHNLPQQPHQNHPRRATRLNKIWSRRDNAKSIRRAPPHGAASEPGAGERVPLWRARSARFRWRSTLTVFSTGSASNPHPTERNARRTLHPEANRIDRETVKGHHPPREGGGPARGLRGDLLRHIRRSETRQRAPPR